MAIPVLTTERLALRGFRESDLDAVAALESDPEVMRFLGTGAEAARPHTRAESWTTMALMMGQWALKGYGCFAVEQRGTGAVIGRAGILHLAGWPEPELAFAFARPAWGQGFAQEACRAVLPWAFAATGAERIVSHVRPANARSLRLLARLGAVREGLGELRGVVCEVWVHRPVPSGLA